MSSCSLNNGSNMSWMGCVQMLRHFSQALDLCCWDPTHEDRVDPSDELYSLVRSIFDP